MKTCSSKAREARFVAALFLALPAALGGTLTAQSTGLKADVFGKPSGVPRSAVDRLSICLTETSTQKIQLCLFGGTTGKTAGIVIGGSQTSLPLYSATLLVAPDLVLFKTFDTQGNVVLTFPLPVKAGLRGYIQGANADVLNPAALFAMSSGVDVQIVKKDPVSTEFDTTTADILMDLAHDAYEYPSRKGKLSPGMQLAAGFQVLTQIQSPNPANEPWFKKMSWPDTQLYIARNASCDIAVVFRGTDRTKLRDLITDLTFRQDSGFHGGFLLAYASVDAKLKATLAQVVHKDARVYITGHSLGGALAPIAAYALAPMLKGLGVPTQNIVLYSFAGPRAMNANRAGELGTLVPHHFAVANKDDIVTHVPLASLGFEHIPNMRVFYPRRAMIAESGSQYQQATLGPLTPGFEAHYQDEYTARIREVLPPPKVWLTVSPTGNMTLNWSFPERAKHGFAQDFIALYKGNPKTQGTNGYLLNQWKSATPSGSHVTGTAKGAGFHVAYIQQYSIAGEQKFLAAAGPYTWSKPSVSLSQSNGWVQLNWIVKDPGRYDYVALYDTNPSTAGPKGYLVGQWQWATNGRNWVSLRRWKAGYYIAYIEDDGLIGQGKVVAVSGPTK